MAASSVPHQEADRLDHARQGTVPLSATRAVTSQGVVARDRWHREAHLQMLNYLSPEEGGSHVQVLDFVDSLRPHMPPNAPTAAVELTAAVNQY
ncbi:hypothetical protein [Streptomyces sp. NPDC029004]|uniref:hypothetical protein n=1 Tax=Streptomyces sp. NPDC029004 TaxID=3154490 RepID=UPI0033C6A48E